MILDCPLCRSRYLISASLFAAGPRQVRCVRCSHSWLYTLPKEIDVVLAPQIDTSPAQEPPPPIPEGSNLPALRAEPLPRWILWVLRGISLTFILIFLSWFLFDRQNIVRQHAWMETVYNVIGLHIYHPGEGLVIEAVRSELHYEDGIMRLLVQGRIHNTTQKTQEIPPLIANAEGSDGSVMQSWQIDAPAATLDADGVMPFQSAINAPRGTVVEINLNFIEPPHDP